VTLLHFPLTPKNSPKHTYRVKIKPKLNKTRSQIYLPQKTNPSHPFPHPHLPHLPLLIITNPQQYQLILPSPKPFFTKHRTQLRSHMHLPFPKPPSNIHSTPPVKALSFPHKNPPFSYPQPENHNLLHPTKPNQKNNNRKQVPRSLSA